MPYYRTAGSFGVGSTIPLGRCHQTLRYRCEHRWQWFIWNEYRRETHCGCWTKVGLGKNSLPQTKWRFLQPWTFIYIRHGRVVFFVFASKFVD